MLSEIHTNFDVKLVSDKCFFGTYFCSTNKEKNMERKITNKKIFTVLILALTLMVALPTTMSVDAAGAKLNKTKVTVCTGKTYTLKMSGVSKKVSWTTSNKKIVSVTKKSGKKAEKCTIKANKKGTATVTAKVKVGKKTKTFKCKVTVKGHSYSKPSYAWNKDFSKCTATKECTRCHKKLTQTVKTSKKTTTKATCTEKGKRTYTAKFSKYDFGTKKKNVSIKALGHAFDKVSYKWNASYSACTAKAVCGRCNASVSEKATVTSKVTKQATKDATGIITHTATFKNKDFSTQTKNVTIPKVAYLDKTSVSVRTDRPVTVKMVNDTIASVSSSNGKIKYTNDTQSVTIKTTDKLGDAKGVVSITTTGGTVLKCDVATEFVPGEYSFGDIHHMYQDTSHNRIYLAYGKNRGFYPAMSDWENYNHYALDCNTKADYDAAYNFYHNKTYRDGRKCDLNQKAQEIESACSERSLWKATNSSVKEDMINEGYDPNNIDDIYLYAELHPAYGRMVFGNLYDTQGNFNKNITSQSQVDTIVTDWANEYNNGVLPSWYYPDVFSDWAEWSGRDLGLN